MLIQLSTLGLFAVSLGLFIFCIWRTSQLLRQRAFSARRVSVYLILLAFFLSIYALRLAVEFRLRRVGAESYGNLNGFELFLDSAVHALQTFSMDEDYTLYLSGLRALCDEVGGGASMAALMGGFSAIQNVAAPVLGGAILLDLLSNLFPRLALLRQCFRPKFVFSELNEKTLSLAESILQNPDHLTNLTGGDQPDSHPWYARSRRKCLIFTDAYVEPGDEAASELLQRAKALGAVCLSDDITVLRMYGVGDVTYLLMDEDETSNLNTAVALAEPVTVGEDTMRRCRQLCGDAADIQILFFSQNEGSTDLVSKVYQTSEDDPLADPSLTVKVVREDTALVYSLLDRFPLYQPLLANRGAGQPADSLSILILGSDPISREMLLASYWCGQMLNPDTGTPISLHLHMVIPQTEGQGAETFRQTLEQTLPGLPLDGSDPYVSFSFYDLDSKGSNLAVLFAQHPELSQCTYLLVSVDGGPVNRDLAHWLQRHYATYYLGKTNPVRILYRVEDNHLCDALNATQEDGCTAVGKRAERYSIGNVFTPVLEERAIHGSNKSELFLRDEYERRSKMADALHAKYKAFSLAPHLLNPWGQVIPTTLAQLTEQLAAACAPKQAGGVDGRDLLAWLEHRRWCAYIFSIGFRAPTQAELEAYFALSPTSDSAKCLPLKLHPCLVDSQPTHAPIRYTHWQGSEAAEYDALDQFSLRFNRMMQKKFPTQWEHVCGQIEELGKALADAKGPNGERYLLNQEGYLCNEDGSYVRNLTGVRAALGASSLQLTLIEQQLILPTDYKQYDYDYIDSLPRRLLYLPDAQPEENL